VILATTVMAVVAAVAVWATKRAVD